MATFRDDDEDPKEIFVYHNAGNSGFGTSSYIDSVILRDRDADTDWGDASDGVLEERIYYCQNWRFDVVALITDSGGQVEQVRYSPYGIPFGLPAGDLNSDGEVDNDDVDIIDDWIDTSHYDVRGARIPVYVPSDPHPGEEEDEGQPTMDKSDETLEEDVDDGPNRRLLTPCGAYVRFGGVGRCVACCYWHFAPPFPAPIPGLKQALETCLMGCLVGDRPIWMEDVPQYYNQVE